ncbi:C40 family peptidase [Dyadobacter sp. 32]|uniref:C40 family peptidase n=1 Tax=Dyadobacter sp. 32 TaxID=538966 RepID=UPI0011EE140C
MNKHISTYLIFIFIFSVSFFSCHTLRKESSKTSAKNNRSRSSNTARPGVASRTPVRKPANKPAPTKKPATVNNRPTYSRSPASAEIPKVVEVARTYSGTPYRSGGNDKSGIDCSGLICSVYSEIGVKVPRISWQQSEFGSEVGSLKDIKPGDWVFFVPEAGREGYVSHAGIVTDVRNQDEIIFIHASTSRGVREDNLFSNYFKGRFVKAMRPFQL